MKLKKLFASVMTLLTVLSTSSMTAFATEVTAGAEATTAPTAAVTEAADPYSGVGSYMAFFQMQTTTWVYRNIFDDAGAGYGTDIFKTIYNNETSAPTSTVINDTVIDGDGEYTISLTNLSLEGSTDFNMVGISTNIPLNSGITITDATLKYGTKTVTTDAVQKTDEKDYVLMMLINQYDNTMKDTVNTRVPGDGTDMIITFNVTGFGYAKTITDAPVAVDTATTSAPSVTAAAAADTATTDSEDSDSSSIPTGVIIGIIAGVVVVAVIIGIVVSKKKK